MVITETNLTFKQTVQLPQFQVLGCIHTDTSTGYGLFIRVKTVKLVL